MGSHISIGFVYSELNLNRIIIELRTIINYLINNGGIVKRMKVSKDVDGDEWLEYNELNIIELEKNINF